MSKVYYNVMFKKDRIEYHVSTNREECLNGEALSRAWNIDKCSNYNLAEAWAKVHFEMKVYDLVQA